MLAIGGSMDKLSLLSRIRSIYEANSNIMQYLRDLSGSHENSTDDIMISYDFQAGSYIEGYLVNPKWKDKYLERLVRIFEELPGSKKSVFEAGVGEATTLIPFINLLNKDVCSGGGGHILVTSQSRTGFFKEESWQGG
jgi:hypothetical protein